MSSIWPIVVLTLQNMFTVLLKHPVYLKFGSLNRLGALINYAVFEFLEIGNLHQIVNREGILSTNLWTTLTVSLFLNLDKKMLFTRKFVDRVLVKFRFKKRKNKVIGELETFYIELKLEIELMTCCMYGIVITLKYFSECVSQIVDCSGRPLPSITQVTTNNYILLSMLIISTLIQIGFKIFLNQFKYEQYGYNPKLRTGFDYFYYVLLMVLIMMRYSLNSLYAMFGN